MSIAAFRSRAARPIRLASALIALAFVAACAQPGPGSSAQPAPVPLARFDPVTMDPPVDDAAPARIDEVVLHSGGALLHAIVYVAAGEGPHPTLVLLHGFPGNERNLDLAHAVRRAGWNAVFFHYRGTWGSGGAFSFAHVLEDARHVVDEVRSPVFAAAHRVDPARIAVLGHSMGGFAALMIASERDDLACAASLAGANLGAMGRAARDPSVAKSMATALGGWSGPIRGTSGTELVRELSTRADAFDLTQRAGAFAKRPLLLVAGARDDVTPPAQHHAPLVDALRAVGAAHVQDVVLADADHAFSNQRIALAHLVIAWLTHSC